MTLPRHFDDNQRVAVGSSRLKAADDTRSARRDKQPKLAIMRRRFAHGVPARAPGAAPWYCCRHPDVKTPAPK